MKSKINQNTTIAELAAIVYSHLENNGIRAILTGGAVVTIYTDNKYESRDLDFLSPHEHEDILRVMKQIGFIPDSKNHKNLSHVDCDITVEFPGRTLIIGGSPEKAEHLQDINGIKVRMLSPTQSVMDRLAAYISWNDIQGLDQAEWISEKCPIDFNKIKKWAKTERATPEQLTKINQYCERGIKKYNNGNKSRKS